MAYGGSILGPLISGNSDLEWVLGYTGTQSSNSEIDEYIGATSL